MNTKQNLNWAVLGTGVIADEMAQAFLGAGKQAYAVGNRTHDKAVTFAKKYQIKKVYLDFHEMFSDKDVDVIYITTPHNTHIEFIREAIKNGKHVLCEKSITLNSRELMEAVSAAKEKGIILGEAMTIYHMPLYKKLRALLSSGILGQVNLIQVNFGSYKTYDMDNRFFNMNLAGGALLDIGVYAFSLARSFLLSRPNEMVSKVHYAPSGADEKAGFVLTNQEGQMVIVSLSLHSKQPKRAVISCERGYIEIMEYPRAEEAVMVDAETGQRTIIREGQQKNALQYEMADMEAAINGDPEIMRLNDTIDVMDMMSEIRTKWQMYYPSETPGEICR